MLITRQNSKGGPKIQNFPIDEDKNTGMFGYKIGYCEGCNEPILLRTIDLREIFMRFGVDKYEVPKETFREWVIKRLGGQVVD